MKSLQYTDRGQPKTNIKRDTMQANYFEQCLLENMTVTIHMYLNVREGGRGREVDKVSPRDVVNWRGLGDYYCVKE